MNIATKQTLAAKQKLDELVLTSEADKILSSCMMVFLSNQMLTYVVLS